MTDSPEYRPGLVFLSPHASYQFQIRGPLLNYNVPTGMPPQQIRPALWADFGDTFGNDLSGAGTMDATPVTGVEGLLQDGYYADVRGGVFVLDEAAQRLGWLDDERELVAKEMLGKAADPRFNDFRLWEPVAPSVPWPNYDETHHFAIPNLAEQTGTLVEALAYERATKNREGVVKALVEKLEAQRAEAALTAA